VINMAHHTVALMMGTTQYEIPNIMGGRSLT
jgi:hypothetical protein